MTNLATSELHLSLIQRAWLQELGLDRAYLSRIASTADAHGRATVATAVPSNEGVSSTQPKIEPPQSSSSLQEAINALRKAANLRPMSVSATSVDTPSDTPVSTVARVIPDDFNELKQSAEACQSCGLHQNRSRVVFGRGATEAVQWFVVADAPSDADDKTGVAIDSHAGVLLTEMLHSVGLDINEDCYVTHMVKCRTLDSQGPTAEEMQACSAYVLKQVELLQPQYVLVLGQQAANQLLGLNEDIDQLRSKIHHWKTPQGRSLPVVVSYHPVSLLLRPQHKANAWRDLALVRGLTQRV